MGMLLGKSVSVLIDGAVQKIVITSTIVGGGPEEVDWGEVLPGYRVRDATQDEQERHEVKYVAEDE